MKNFALFLFLVWTLGCKKSNSGYSVAYINSVEEIIDDMTLPHEAAPKGVPASYNWAQKPRLGMGNTPGIFTALIAWGQVYETSAGNTAANTRVELRNIRTYLLSRKTDQWTRVQATTSVDGAAYREDFANDQSKPAAVRIEPSGGLSVVAGNGYNFHFWPISGRVTINPNDIAGVFTTVQARLVLDNPNAPDDRSKAQYVLSMGADYWLNQSAQWDNFKTNGDVGIGRFKLVTTQWKAFNMSSATPQQLRQNPPPLE